MGWSAKPWRASGERVIMQTDRGEAAPLGRCPRVLFGSLAGLIALFPLPGFAATVVLSGIFDTRILLTLGIALGIIAFSIGSAIACLRATQAARRAYDEAALE